MELKSMRVKVDHQSSILKQGKEIVKLNAKIDAKLISGQSDAAPLINDGIQLHSTANKNKIRSFDDSSTRPL